MLGKINRQIEAYLTAEEPNAAGRMGLFRIIFSVFYLWVIASYSPAYLYHLPDHLLDKTLAVRFLPNDLPLAFYQGIFALLVGSLVMLAFGCFTRTATVLVVMFGWMVESHYISSGFEHGTIFLGFIPFFMMICGDWGSTWSIDAIRKSNNGSAIDPADTSPRFVMPMHGSLVVLAALFCSAGIYKLIPWTTGDNVFGYHLLDTNIKLAKLGYPVNPTAEWFLDWPILDDLMRAFIVLFELTFPLALLGRKLRTLYLYTGILFNAINGAFLGVTFTPMLIVYLFFVDWHGLITRAWTAPSPGWTKALAGWSSAVGLILLAIICAGLWISSRLVQNILTLGGSINNRTLWYPIVPIALAGFAWSSARVLHAGIVRFTGRPEATARNASSG